MPQILLPTSDIFFTGQTVPASQPAWSVLDDLSNTDHVELNHFGSPEVVQVGLSAATDPEVHTDHYVRVMAAKDDNSTAVKLRAELRQGSATILGFELFDLTTSLAEVEWAVPTVVAAAITDYAALTLYMSTTLNSPVVYVSYARVQVPDAGFAHLTPDGAGFLLAPSASGSYLVPDGPGLRQVAGVEGSGSITDFLPGFRVRG